MTNFEKLFNTVRDVHITNLIVFYLFTQSYFQAFKDIILFFNETLIMIFE